MTVNLEACAPPAPVEITEFDMRTLVPALFAHAGAGLVGRLVPGLNSSITQSLGAGLGALFASIVVRERE